MGDSVLIASVRPGNAQTLAGLRRQQQQAKKSIESGIKVDKEAETSFKLAREQIRQNITPLLPSPQMLEAQQEDRVAQFNIALDHLKSIMPSHYAAEVARGLSHQELQLLNRHWKGFSNAVGGTQLNPGYFHQYWRRYQELLNKTNSTGIVIPLQSDDLAVLKNEEPVGGPAIPSSTGEAEEAEYEDDFEDDDEPSFRLPPPREYVRPRTIWSSDASTPTVLNADSVAKVQAQQTLNEYLIKQAVRESERQEQEFDDFARERAVDREFDPLYKELAKAMTGRETKRLVPMPGSPGSPYKELTKAMTVVEDGDELSGREAELSVALSREAELELTDEQNQRLDAVDIRLEALPKFIQDGIREFGERFLGSAPSERGRVVGAMQRHFSVFVDVPKTVWNRMDPTDRFLWVMEKYLDNWDLSQQPRKGRGLEPGGAQRKLEPIPGPPGDPQKLLEKAMGNRIRLVPGDPGDPQEELEKAMNKTAFPALAGLPRAQAHLIRAFWDRFGEAANSERGRIVNNLRRQLGVDLNVSKVEWNRMDPADRFSWVVEQYIRNWTLSQQRRGARVRVGGRGIAPDENPRYERFGRYLIHIPSLHKNILNIKFPSLAANPRIPQKVITKSFAELLQDLVATGQLSPKLYAELSDDDKDYFADIAHQCQIGGKLGLSRKEDNADMERFAVIRGEILAGNDAPQLIKELKHLTLKLVADGKIPKKSAHDLLIEIAVLS